MSAVASTGHGSTAGPSHPQRPGPWQWIRYAFGAGLPAELSEWVFNDITSRTWVLRHISRALTQLAPIIILIAVFVPGPVWIRIVMILAGTLLSLIFSAAYIDESADHRLIKAGYAAGLGQRTRKQRSATAQHEALMKRRAKSAARRSAREH